MRRGSVGLVILTAAVAVAGGDAPQVDPRTPEQWRTGEVVTATVMESSATRLTRSPPATTEGAAHDLVTRLDARFTVRCLDADAEGHLVRSLVRIDAWSIKADGRDDRSLEGGLVETGPARWTLLAAGCNPSRVARSWLDARFGSGGAALCDGLSDLGALGPVAVGDSWSGVAPPMPQRLAASGLPVSLGTRPWKFAVADIVPSPLGAMARVTFDETLPVRDSGKSGNRPVHLAEGSTVRVRGSIASVPGLAHRTGRMDAASDTDLSVSTADSRTRLAIRGEQRETWDAGGVAPQAPALPPGAPTPRTIGAAESWSPGDACAEIGSEHVVVVATPVNIYGREATPERGEWTVSWNADVECEDADAAGRPGALAVKLVAWKAVRGKEVDASLDGAVLRVSRGGFKVVTGAPAASDLASAWLRTHYGEGAGRDDALRVAMTPAMPVAAKQSWHSDADDTAAALRTRFQFAFDPATLQGRATFAGLDGDDGNARASIEYVIDARIPAVAHSDTASVEAMTGAAHVAGTASGPIVQWSRFGSVHDATQIAVAIAGVGPNEDHRRLVMAEERDIVRSPLAPQAQSARTWTRAGVEKAGRGDTDGAIAAFTKAIEADAGFAPAYDHRGVARFEKGEDAPSIADFTKAIAIDPRDTAAWNDRGAVRDDQGDADGAIADWTRSIEIDPRQAGAHLHLARARFQPGLPAAPVVEAIRTAIESGRSDDYPHLWLWLARVKLGEETDATKELTSYLTARQTHAVDEWYPSLAGLLAGTTSEEAVLAAAKTADDRTSAERLCEATCYAGIARAVRGDVAGAISLLDRCLATDVHRFTEFAEARRWRRSLLLGATTRQVSAADGRTARSIVSPDPQGPAARAGLLDGDVIVSIDGVPFDAGRLDRLLLERQPGTTVRFGAKHNAQPLDANVILGMWPAR